MRTTPLLLAVALSALSTQALAQTADWTELFPPSDPGVRVGMNGASDGSSFYFFGGNAAGGVPQGDLWSFDGTTWTLESPAGSGPPDRVYHNSAWDAARNVLVIFGGRDAALVNLSDTWEWSKTGGWSNVTPVTGPSARRVSDMAYFPGLGVVMHGGKLDSGSPTSETWLWDGTSWTSLAAGPVRSNACLVYRAQYNDILTYGGKDASAVTNETWSFNGVSWTQIPTTTAPGATVNGGLYQHHMYHNPNDNLTVVFGGQQTSATNSRTWEFDGTDWTEVFPATTPPHRQGGAIAWVPGLGKAIMYGGFGSGQYDDTWERGSSSIPGSFAVSGTGCPTTMGLTAGLSAQGLPTIGQSLIVELTNGTIGAVPLGVVGTSDTLWSGIPLPLDFSLIFPGTPSGCNLYIDIFQLVPMTATAGGATMTLPIPSNPNLVSKTFFVQALQLEVVLGALHVSVSPYGTAVVGG